MPEPAVEHLVEARVARVVVVGRGCRRSRARPNRCGTRPSSVRRRARRRRARRAGPGTAVDVEVGLGAGGDQRARPRRAGRAHRWPRPARRSARDGSIADTVPPGTGRLPFAACTPVPMRATTPDKPAVIMGATGEVMTFAELDAGGQPPQPAAARRRPAARATTSRSAWRTTPATSRSSGAATTPGSIYTACSSRLTSGELATSSTTARRKVFITSQYKADQAAEIVADTPGVELRLMLDGTIDGYESLRGRRRRAVRPSRSTDRIAGTDMLYSSGTTGRPKGVDPRVRGRRRSRQRPSGVGRAAAQLLFGVDDRQRLPVAGAAVPRRAAALLHGGPRARRHGRRDGALRRRAVPGARRAATASPTARSCRRCSCACSSCPTRCAPSTTCRRCECVDPRRRAVPGPGQAADDRVVRAR